MEPHLNHTAASPCLQELAAAVCELARSAGHYIAAERERFQGAAVQLKHAHDYVSYVDRGSEALIVEGLRQLLPAAGFVTEEGSATYADEDYCWVVDPLDGTTNFIHRFPPYCVSIALCRGREMLIGVVYEVTADECFWAWKGGGAWKDGERLSVSSHPTADALICLQLPYDSQAYSPVIHRLIDAFYGRAASVRMMGSAAMALCYVACGRLDAYAEKFIGRWDYMAGALIVAEAGGRVTDYEGSPHFTGGNSVVATNGLVHQDLLAAISDACG